MKKHSIKPSAIIFFILLSTSIFANKTPNYPKGFSPKTNSSISFTENKGQMHDQNYKSRPDVLFSGTDGNLVFHLKNNGISYQLYRVDTWKKESDVIKKHADAKIKNADEKLVADQSTIYRLDINWLNANTDAEVTKQNPLDGFNNYYSENCPNGALNVKSFQQITYQNIYDGIDLKWYEKDGHLEYDYLVSAGADYKQIQLEIKGADKLTLNNKGELIYKTPLGDIIEQAPLVKQNGKTLKSKWIIKNNVLSFEIENLNMSEVFIIDPVVRMWGTYYGGFGYDIGYSSTTDVFGNVYLAGETNSTSGIATAGAHQNVFAGGNSDAYLVKFNSNGIRQWGTYYGGSSNERGFSCTTDASGNVYLAGTTTSTSGIASAGAHQTTIVGVISGYTDAYLVKFNSNGVRQWGTYYGTNLYDSGNSCTTDASGNVYLAGATNSISDIATTGAHQTIISTNPNINGTLDAFLVKFNSNGVRQWGTYYGGIVDDYGFFCTTDVSGNVYMSGYTASNSFIATAGAHQTVYGGNNDAFLVKFNSNGVRQWGTYYGGSGNENQSGGVGNCATDASGNVYLGGTTTSTSDIASAGAHQTTIVGVISGYRDAYLVKFNSNGVRQWGTYYGGSSDERGFSCTTDALGNVYLAGATSSTSDIATAGAYQTIYVGTWRSAFLVKFNSSGLRQWGTYYGGNGETVAMSCTTNASGNVYMTGYTDCSSGIATTGAHQTVWSADYDVFLVKFNDCLSPSITVNSGAICAGQSFTINPNGANTYTIQGGNAVVNPSINTTYTVIGTSTAGCVSQAVATSSLIVNPNPIISVNSGAICAGQSFTINPTGANTYTIQGGNAVVSPSISSTYTVAGTSTSGCKSLGFATSNLTVNPNPTITVNSGAICVGQSFTINPNGANTYTIQGGNPVVSPNSNSSYTVAGTSTSGCKSQGFATSNLTVNANPTITVNSGFICAGENFTIYPSGANTYSIQGGNAVVNPTINITYTVAGTSTAGCVSQTFATSSLTVNLCVGISNQNMALGGVSIYPNPNNGEFTIELLSVNNTYITITNVLGQIIKTQKAELMNQINLNLYDKGIYFINVMDNNQSVYKGSIIKE